MVSQWIWRAGQGCKQRYCIFGRSLLFLIFVWLLWFDSLYAISDKADAYLNSELEHAMLFILYLGTRFQPVESVIGYWINQHDLC
jgi:hypothetical protein